MSGNAPQPQSVDRLIGLRLRQLQQATGLPAVFGGATSAVGAGLQLRIGHLRGTLGQSLLDLRVDAGRGLGGSAIQTGTLRTVPDYASNHSITHDFDGIVVQEERISSIFALPLMISGKVGGVLYGAVRGPHSIGGAVLDRASAFGASLERELTTLLSRPAPGPPGRHTAPRARAALDELDELARTANDPALRERLRRIADDLRGATGAQIPTPAAGRATPRPDERPALAPREVETLGLVAVGMSNSEVAQAMGLSTETVRAYLRSAMRRLDVHNRTAAVHAARSAGLL